MRLSRLFALLLLVPLGVGAQVGIVGDSTLPLRPRVEPVRFVLPVPPELGPAGILQPVRSDAATLAAQARARLAARVAERQARAFQRTLESPRIPEDPRVALVRPFLESQVAAPRDTTLLDQYADLGLQLSARLESKLDRQKNERCTSSQLFSLTSQCQGTFQPTFDFQFNVRTGGVVADRVHVNVDYDSQREFDASNNISVFYQGKSDELLKKIEVGNVSFTPPPSRFITSGIPSNNYGLQTEGQLGPMRFRGIVAQQKGNVSKDNTFTVGDRTLQTVDREIEDYQIEPRRFFFTVDPRSFPGYPNVDLLNNVQIQSIAAGLPDSIRPTRLVLYRLLIGGQPPNPNGPQFRIIGDPTSRRGQIYEVLRENIDYYADPSLLWVALLRPLNLNNERLVAAYTVRLGGRDTTLATTGGTPDLEFVADRDQFANLLWDPLIRPTDAAFSREIRSIYRIGGEDVRRTTVTAKLVTGSAGDQEKPAGGSAQTYLQLFGLAQSGNPSQFDVENRLWPRPGDPNISAQGGAQGKIIRDHFLIFPSLQPFARAGLAGAIENPANDTIYRTPAEYLYSAQHPPSFYRLRVRYDAEGGGDAGSLSLGSVQLRQGSERILLEGVPLKRDVDYRVDYELGKVTFLRPDTLFPRARQVTVRFEENPLFATAPTNILGFASEIPFQQGQLNFVAISQRQRTQFNRPPLGFEPQSMLLAGVNGAFDFEAEALSRVLQKVPGLNVSGTSRFRVEGELATSRPTLNAAGQAYIESFEGEGGVQIALGDPAWYLSSQPALGRTLAARLGAATLDLSRASTLAWQSNGLSSAGQTVTFSLSQIDPFAQLAGSGVQQPEQMLWLTLYPLSIGGARNDRTGQYQWRVAGAPTGRRWRSVRTPLGAAGTDLSRVENLEFWTLIDTAAVRRARNPTMIFDFGDISENTVALAPSRLDVTRTGAGTDTLYSGRRLAGFDTLDTERDQFSRSFNQDRDDNGLAGDVVRALPFATPDSSGVLRDWKMCSRGDLRLALLGDTRTNCTVKNARLDEEDVDADNVLNFEATQRESERLFRYVVDFADPRSYTRIGNCNVVQIDTVNGVPEQSTRCWVFFRVPFGAPTDSINGGPTIRRVRALRMTMVSGAAAPDAMFSQVPIARFRLIGAPWLKRGDRALRGIAGEEPAQAFVAASVIGTTDRDSTSGLVYESPPGVVDQPDRQITGLGGGLVQVNERSMRITAGGTLGKFQRAEAFYRFPEGQKNFMQYRQLRVWARGRGRGWGERGELQFFVKAGRDANNFYMFRTPVNAGLGEAAWLPEVRVDFEKLFALRAALQNSFLQGRPDSIACSGVDSLMIARSGLPAGTAIRRFAACSGGYMVYTIDPNVSPPNLAAVQELGVGIIRVDSGTVGGDAPMASDTLELWVDDIRLTDVVNTPGYAGQVGVNLSAADVASFRVNISNRDPFFRGLNEAPSFVSNNGIEMGSNVRLEKFLPAGLGIALPLAISRSSSGSDPYFVSRADIRGDGIQGLRTPRGEATNVSLALRRIGAPRGGLWGAVVDNLSATASWNSARSRSEFQDGRISGVNAGADYLVSAPARVVAMPAWIDKAIGALPQWMQRAEFVKSLKGGAVRWNPASVRISSTLNRTADRRLSFTKPADAATDTGRVVSGLAHLLRNVAAVEFRPFNALSGRLDFTSLRDLRDYGDSTPAAVVARSERDRLLGRDLGLERERQLNASVGIQPALSSWMRGRLDISSTFAMQRDPNTRQLVQTEDSLGAFRLPRRASNGRALSATATLDLPRFLQTYFNDSLTRKRIVPFVLPIDITWNRGLLSAFDGTAFTPGAAYQFAWGGIDAFRAQAGRAATSAGLNQQLTVASGLRLPFGVSLTGRSQRALTRGWTRRLDNTQALVEGSQVTYPDLNVRWNWRPTTSFVSKAITQIGTQFRYNDTRQSTVVQPEAATTAADARISRARQLPLNTTITWNIGGGLVTSFSRSVSHRADSLPGSVTESNGKEASGDVSRAFKLPADWKVKSDLRTRMSYQTRRDVAFVQTRGGTGNRSRLTDNGRTAMNINADADVAENLTFSLQGSRILTFDNNFNRRFSQFVMTAVLQISFFAGEIR